MTMRNGVLGRSREELRPAVALFHGLSDAARLAIVQHLSRGEARVVDLTGELGLAQSTVSAHLACLRDCGLVVGRPEGRQMFYSLTRPELLDLLTAAETLLAATGSAVKLCPHYGAATCDTTTSGTAIAAEDTNPDCPGADQGVRGE